MSSFRIIPVATVASIAALVTAVIVFSLLLPPAKQPAESVPIGGPFELVDQDGIKVTDKTFAGRPSVLFFGYTSCPDVCPTTLSGLSTWLNAIGSDADKLNVLFISIDPERDTSAHLREYLSSFDRASTDSPELASRLPPWQKNTGFTTTASSSQKAITRWTTQRRST